MKRRRSRYIETTILLPRELGGENGFHLFTQLRKIIQSGVPENPPFKIEVRMNNSISHADDLSPLNIAMPCFYLWRKTARSFAYNHQVVERRWSSHRVLEELLPIGETCDDAFDAYAGLDDVAKTFRIIASR